MHPFELKDESLWSRLSVSYMEPIFRSGIRKAQKGKEPALEDLPLLGDQYKTATGAKSFDNISRSRHLIFGIIKEVGYPFYLSIALEVFSLVLSASDPGLMQRLIMHFEETDPDLSSGLCLVGYMMLREALKCILLSVKLQLVHLIRVRAEGIVVASVMEKAVRLQSEQLDRLGAGEIVAVMESARDISWFLTSINNFWCLPLKFLVTLGQLVIETGWPCLLSVLISYLSFYLNYRLAKKRNDIWTVIDARRLDFWKQIYESLHGVKAIKLNCWEDYVAKKIRDFHTEIVDMLNSTYLILNVNAGQEKFFGQLIVVVAVLLSCWKEGTLTASKAYILLVLFDRLKRPLMQLSWTYSEYTDVRTKLARFKKLVVLPERTPLLSTLPKGNIKLSEISVQCVERANDPKESSRNRIVLEGVSLEVKQGELVGISGPVACGKSILLKAIIGETGIVKGKAEFGGSIAYLPHESWIISDTLRTNIVMNKEFAKEKYERVLDLCQLTEDIKTLKDKDLTIIGSRGVNLSGGQRQRVVLARAIYSDADIYLFDDSLAQLDPQVARSVFSEAIVKYLSGKTRLFVTNNPVWLAQFPRILLVDGGKVACDGDYQTVYSKVPALFAEEPAVAKLPEAKSSDNSDSEREEEDEEEEDKSSKRRLELTWEHAKRLFFRGRKLLLVGFIVAFILGNFLCELDERWLFAWSYDMYKADIKFYLIMYVVIILLNAGFKIVPDCMHGAYEKDAFTELHNDMTARILKSSLAWHYENETGAISNKLGASFYHIRSPFFNVSEFAQNLCFIIVFFYQIVVRVPEYMLCFGALALAFRFLHKMHQAVVEHSLILDSQAEDARTGRTEEFIEGILVVRTPGNTLGNWAKNRVYEKRDDCLRAFFTTIMSDRWMELRWAALSRLIYAVMLVLCLTRQESMPSAVVAIVTLYVQKIESELNGLFMAFGDIKTFMLSSLRTLNFVFSSPLEDQGGIAHPSDEWPRRGEIAVHGLCMRYKETLPPVIKDAEFKIRAGEKIGLVGRTGCGKSTILLGLLRVLEPETRHAVKIDGQEISEVSLRSLRTGALMIPQEPWVFTGTVRDNIDPFQKCSDDRIVQVLETLRLKGLLDKKLDARSASTLAIPLSEGGNNLSQGEKQLLCIARALVQTPKILLMDEATANLDEESEENVKRIIAEELKDTTVIMIAHRPNVLKACGRVLKVLEGKCVEQQCAAVS